MRCQEEAAPLLTGTKSNENENHHAITLLAFALFAGLGALALMPIIGVVNHLPSGSGPVRQKVEGVNREVAPMQLAVSEVDRWVACPELNGFVDCLFDYPSTSSCQCNICMLHNVTLWSSVLPTVKRPNKTKLVRSVGRKPVYLIIAIPPFWGSSAIEGLLSTSPAVATMCHLGTWQCEATWELIRAGLMTNENRWDADQPDWDAAYRHMHTHMSQPSNLAEFILLADISTKRKYGIV